MFSVWYSYFVSCYVGLIINDISYEMCEVELVV